MGVTTYYDDTILDTLLETSLYLVMCTADPTTAATGASCNEHPNSGGYSRQALGAAQWAASADGTKTTGAVIEFTEATGNWTELTHFAIADSGTYGAGNVRYIGELTSPVTVSTGEILRIPIGDLTATIS
jgi:hypothetical protein